jgi:hypothetical protein
MYTTNIKTQPKVSAALFCDLDDDGIVDAVWLDEGGIWCASPAYSTSVGVVV